MEYECKVKMKDPNMYLLQWNSIVFSYKSLLQVHLCVYLCCRIVKEAGVSVSDAAASWYLQVLATTVTMTMPLNPQLQPKILEHTRFVMSSFGGRCLTFKKKKIHCNQCISIGWKWNMRPTMKNCSNSQIDFVNML